MLAFDFDNPAEAAKSARVPVHPIFNQITEWRWYYPDNARVPRIDPRTICRKCGAPMRPGKAIVTLATGTSDFGDGDVATMSPDPSKPKMIDCLKCEQCGWSVTP